MPQQVDYDALAQQHGAQAAAVDYDALAAQHGGNSVAPPKEGYLHSLGSTFGVTPELLKENAQQPLTGRILMSLPGFSPALGIAQAVPELAKKSIEEDAASAQAAKNHDFLSFLAHQGGAMGYAGGIVTSPITGSNPVKFGDQVAEGNIRGALGTATGMVAPAFIPEIPGAMRATGRGLEAAAPYLGKGAKEAARFGGVGEFIHTGNPVALAGPALADMVGKGTTQATSWMGRFLQKAGAGLDFSPSQEAAISKAESKAKAVPAGDATPLGSSPSTIPRTNSGEGVLNMALTSLDNKSLIKIAKSRGIDVTREVQLKPGAANNTLIKKIIDDFTPDELDEIRNMGIEIGRHAPVYNPNVTPEAAAEAWHYKVLTQFFPDVQIPKTMEARAQATIANRPMSPREQAFYAQAAGEANAVPVDDLAQGVNAGASAPGKNYVIKKSGDLTYHGTLYAPEMIPPDASHVTVLPDGTFRVNAGMELNPAQQRALQDAVGKPVQPQTSGSGSAIEELLRQSLIRRGITPPK